MSGIHTHSISFCNSSIYYETIGQHSYTLVFIHGWCCSSQLWKGQLQLADKYRLILIDLPGHGRSGPTADGVYSLELCADAVHAVLQHAGVEKAGLVGHSMGGPVCTMVLRLYPSLVDSILYVDSFFRVPEAYLTQRQRRERRALISSDDEFERLLRSAFCSPHTTQSMQDQIIQTMVYDTSREVRLGTVLQDNWQAHALRQDECFPYISALHLCTEAYSFVDVDWLRLLSRLRVDSHNWIGYGHFFFLENAERFNLQVEEFYNSI